MLTDWSFRGLSFALLAAFVVWLLMAILDVGGQRSLFYREGSELLSDFWMPRTCLEEGYSSTGEEFPVVAGVQQSGWQGGKMRVLSYDRCYPAAALMPLAAFPATWEGAWIWSILAMAAFLGSLCLVMQDCRALILSVSMPVLYCLERGNLIVLSAAAVGLFLAWYRSVTPWRRMVAALALACAVCLKVSPVLLGVLYLRERDWKGLGWCALFASAAFVVPWLFVPGGFGALPVMLENAQANAVAYARASEFGLVEVWRTVRVLLHQDCMQAWPGCLVVSHVSQALGIVAVTTGACRKDVFAVVLGMLWAAGNMHYYGALYLLPVFLLEVRDRYLGGLRLLLWFAILCPLQLVLFGHAANAVICNLTSFVLIWAPPRRVMV